MNYKIKLRTRQINLNTNQYIRDSKLTTRVGNVNLRPNKSTHWVLYMQENSLDSFGCPPIEMKSVLITKRNGR